MARISGIWQEGPIDSMRREKPMTETRSIQSPTQTQMRVWETKINELWSKLHSAKPLEKIGYYEEIKAIEEKLTAARKSGARTDVTKE